MFAGLFGSQLGGGLIKKRAGRIGAGKRGGFRLLIVYKTNDRLIFLFGFAKNESETLELSQLRALKILSKKLLNIPEESLQKLINSKQLMEVEDGN